MELDIAKIAQDLVNRLLEDKKKAEGAILGVRLLYEEIERQAREIGNKSSGSKEAEEKQEPERFTI